MGRLRPGAPAKDRAFSICKRNGEASWEGQTVPIWTPTQVPLYGITQKTEDQLSQASSSWTTASFLSRGR